MSAPKLGKTRGFRPRPQVREWLELADAAEINTQPLINDCLEETFLKHLVKAIAQKKPQIENVLKQLDLVLKTPLP